MKRSVFLVPGFVLILSAAFLPAQADEPADTLLRQVVKTTLEKLPLVAEYEITCRYKEATWKIHGKAVQAEKEPLHLQWSTDNPGDLDLYFPSGTFLSYLHTLFTPLPDRFPFPEGKPAQTRLLPTETIAGTPYRVVELVNPLPRGSEDGAAIPKIAQRHHTVRWTVGPDLLVHRIQVEIPPVPGSEVPGQDAPLHIEALLQVREPHNSKPRSPSGPPLRTLIPVDPADTRVTDLCFAPDGRQCALVCADYSVQLWDLVGGKPTFRLTGHLEPILAAVFLADNRTLATVDQGGVLAHWDLRTGKLLQTFRHDIDLTTGAFSPDGKLLAVGNSQGTITVWDAATGKEVRHVSARPVQRLRFSPEGSYLAGAGWNGGYLWETAGWQAKELRVSPPGSGVFTGGWSLAFSPDGRFLAVGPPARQPMPWEERPNPATTGPLTPLQIWDTATGKRVHQIEGPVGPAVAVVFSPDGKWLAIGDSDTAGEAPGNNAAVTLWETTGWKLMHTLAVDHKRSVSFVRFSPDGKILATGDNSPAISLWAVPPP